ncbi:MAG: cell division protein FtsA [Alphaproteobacteria bacterium]|nr:cell division protein FtsA [Alphaproteobacteria bacterium]
MIGRGAPEMGSAASLLDAAQGAPSARPALHARACALDVGVSKTACLIGAEKPSPRNAHASPILLEGLALENAPGFASGKGADFDACARSIRIALDEAERGAGGAVSHVTLSYSGPGLRGRIVRGGVKVRAAGVGPREARAALAAALQSAPAPGCAALHVLPIGYAIDGGELIPDPRGMPARWLEAEVCLVTAPAPAVEALKRCARGAGAATDAVIAGPFAAGLACTTDDERDAGVLTIDLGAGGTGAAVFAEGCLVHLEHIPMGGARITRDIAKRLETTFAVAERAKLLFGCVGGGFDPREAIEAPRLGADGRLESYAAPRGLLADAISLRLAEIFSAVRASVNAAALGGQRTPRRAVLVGGGALLPGAAEFAADYLGLPTRVGALHAMRDYDQLGASPAFAASAGVLGWRLAQTDFYIDDERPSEPSLRELGAGAAAAATRAWGWLKQNF